ncbi:hypothetical protein DR64_8516 [Paraburkholderia xenovorans LB400]|nr:hypothetical protein DR64_8516 [Paraburkholderia xenovorans LB400]
MHAALRKRPSEVSAAHPALADPSQPILRKRPSVVSYRTLIPETGMESLEDRNEALWQRVPLANGRQLPDRSAG